MQIIDGNETYDVMNTSGGIQSTTMFWAAMFGDLPMPDCFIFADTGWERETTYKTIEGLIAIAKEREVPFYVVNNGNVRIQALESGNPNSTYPGWRDEHGYAFLKMPVYTKDQMGNSKVRMSSKQCTTDFKIRPIRKFLRETYGTKKVRFNQWIGISLDEARRMRTSDVKYVTITYPLIEKRFGLRWSRGHCIEYLKKHNIEIPAKSACIGCPLHSDENWFALTDAEKQEAIEFDESIRHLQAHVDALPKPKKIPEGQLTLIDMDEVDEYIAMHPLERRQDVELYCNANGLPLSYVFDNEDEVRATQQELYGEREDAPCDGGMCFV